MTFQALIQQFSRLPQVEQLIELLKKSDQTRLSVRGLVGSGRYAVMAAMRKDSHQPHIYIANDREEAAYAFNDLENMLGKEKALFFPASARHPYKEEKTDNANILHRAEVLNAMMRPNFNPIIVTYPEALSEMVVTKKELKQHTLQLKKGETLSIEFVMDMLLEYGFERVDFVAQPGQFAQRGGLIDVFSFSHDYPYRIEFFGDEVDSIRAFHVTSQLSIETLKKVTILPNVQDKQRMESRESLLDFVPEKCVIWVQDIEGAGIKLERYFDKAQAAFDKLNHTVTHVQPSELYMDQSALMDQLQHHSTVEMGAKTLWASETITFNQTPQPAFNKQFKLWVDFLLEKPTWQHLVFSRNAGQIERLHEILDDVSGQANIALPDPPFVGMNYGMHQGFVDEDVQVACFTDHQILERFHRFRLKEGYAEAQQNVTLKELTSLQKGDYVTHIDHGVGQFDGMQRMDVNGKMQEVIRLVYGGGDYLYVSVQSLHRIARYSSKDGSVPKVHKLGSKAWKNLKNKTKTKVKEIAFDLIQLYAERKAQKGFQFSPDSYLQHELEASFIYEDTPDQEKATKAVKADMESESPMDRLICGDVGFGKTEIAIRAAFKAVADSKQVAILVPTTILALQHFQTFSQRLKGMPCKVDYINRFKTAGEQKDTLKRLEDGEIDIIIGTHRLAGKDVKFKELGLLIIDEEQKFGVSVKDKLKTLKSNIDTLTLTATPIPRTLQFSLMQARDMSIINTPPPNRHPVQSEIHGFNEEMLRDAIRYEMARGGQVFFVHNRVQNIQEVAGTIQRLIPEARVAIGHGQMEPEKLEAIMLDFIDGLYDVLVATTIIESGLDIPNANTIIINHAENFGLSDLHQMRGRVGRSNKKAFCYLLTPPLATLSNDARKRLTAIEQFSDLGSGFNIAMRDLDIRGAGNLLGGEQSGFMADIGFEMYQKILDEAIQELKENEFKDLFQSEEHDEVFVRDCQIDTDLEVMIPPDYVDNISERINLYKELSDIENLEELEKFKGRMEDRFGEIPVPTERLIRMIQLQWLAKPIGFERIVLKQKQLICYFVANQSSNYYQSARFTGVLGYLQANPQKVEMREKNEKLSLKFKGVNDIAQAIELLEEIADQLGVKIATIPAKIMA